MEVLTSDPTGGLMPSLPMAVATVEVEESGRSARLGEVRRDVG